VTILFTNNAKTTLSAGITNVATSIPVAAGYGALFPAPSGSDFFYATLTDVSNNIEIVKVTSRSTDTMTVVRGQEGTTARAYLTGDKFQLRITAASLTAFVQLAGTQTLTNKTIDTAGPNTIKVNGNTLAASAGTATVTVPNSTDTLVGKATTDTLTNKTIDTAGGNVLKVNGNTLAASAGTATVTVPNSTDTLVGKATTDTLTNKTIDTAGGNVLKVNGNTLAASAGTATVTVPNSTDTLVGKATTDTLTNKTFDTAGAGNSLLVAGVAVTALAGTTGASGSILVNGVRFQWGSGSVTPAGGGTAGEATITFTTPFASACRGVIACPDLPAGGVGGSSNYAIYVRNISAAGCNIGMDSNGGASGIYTCYYLAWGD